MTDERFRSIMAIIINVTIVWMIAEYTNWTFAIGAVLALCAGFVYIM